MEHVISTPVNEEGARIFLIEQGWPKGLQDSVIATMTKIRIRYFIIDNSSSMKIKDGHILVKTVLDDDEIEFM